MTATVVECALDGPVRAVGWYSIELVFLDPQYLSHSRLHCGGALFRLVFALSSSALSTHNTFLGARSDGLWNKSCDPSDFAQPLPTRIIQRARRRPTVIRGTKAQLGQNSGPTGNLTRQTLKHSVLVHPLLEKSAPSFLAIIAAISFRGAYIHCSHSPGRRPRSAAIRELSCPLVPVVHTAESSLDAHAVRLAPRVVCGRCISVPLRPRPMPRSKNNYRYFNSGYFQAAPARARTAWTEVLLQFHNHSDAGRIKHSLRGTSKYRYFGLGAWSLGAGLISLESGLWTGVLSRQFDVFKSCSGCPDSLTGSNGGEASVFGSISVGGGGVRARSLISTLLFLATIIANTASGPPGMIPVLLFTRKRKRKRNGWSPISRAIRLISLDTNGWGLGARWFRFRGSNSAVQSDLQVVPSSPLCGRSIQTGGICSFYSKIHTGKFAYSIVRSCSRPPIPAVGLTALEEENVVAMTTKFIRGPSYPAMPACHALRLLPKIPPLRA
ncbi:hypothetical protein C8R47DRAFT_1062562 [Mycena vitilis]|nr:hypothetical protein C8R47DRAFT_1062562 [Mycena vitilis]